MKPDKIKLYISEILLVLVMTFLALFESKGITKIFLACILFIFAFIISKVIKKRNILSTSSNQIFYLMIGFAIIYLALFYLLGMYFGFAKAGARFSLWTIRKFILPLSVIVVSSEVIRSILLAQKGRFNTICVFIAMVLIDVIVYTQMYDLADYDDFLIIIGYVTFASTSCNLLYNYISARYGYKPVMIYRLITTLYLYIIPVVPNIMIFIRSIVRMIFPYFVYLIIDKNFANQNKLNTLRERNNRIISNTVLLAIAFVVAYLVSCQFTFGMFVVGSGSMTGTINKGDAVIYKKLGNSEIKEGEVIVFKKNNVTIIHRVVDIQIINGEYRYYTKGDANQVEDESYSTKSQIVGKSVLRVRYIGYPTLWLRSAFNKFD